MTFNKTIQFSLYIGLLFLTACAFVWFIIHKTWIGFWICIPLIIYFIYHLLELLKRTDTLLLDFIESIRYKDYSRNYDVKNAPKDMRPILSGLNAINNQFKNIAREKSAENIYLHKILEMVDIGIISFEKDTGSVTWMNESFKNLTHIPYLKNIQALAKRNPELLQAFLNMKPGTSDMMLLKKGMTTDKILMYATDFYTEEKHIRLISIHNVNEPIDETESKAWQKLLNVMTHEIMNSVAPISSLADTLKSQVAQAENENTTIDKEDLQLGLETIKNRSEGLQRFATTYRNLNKVTKPNLKKVFIRDIFENLQTLMQPTLDQKNIDLHVILKDPQLKGTLDVNLIEQVLINLITNAIEAVKEKQKPIISLSAYTDNDKTCIKVADNGKGIPDNIADQIFIPFFSTRKNGNGIGLSLCKQIMLLHKGSIQVQSREGEGTAFTVIIS